MRPSTETELAEIVLGAAGPLFIRGGGTRAIGRTAGDPLETAGLAGVRLYEPGALTLVAGAGTPLAEIEAMLAGEGQRLPFEVPDMRGLLGRDGVSTLGGMVAANASGPRRIQAGACRDSLIGVRFVDGAGQVVKNGGRVMKNVTGYDLVKLLAGSHGTLGVLSEVSFKLLPMPERTVTLALPDLAPARAVEAMAMALGSPFDVSGAAHWPGRGTFLRIEGFEASVRYRTARLRALLARFGEAGEVDDPWAEIRDVAPFHAKAGDVWRLSLKPSDAPAVAERAGGAALFDWGGGLLWVLCEAGTDLRGRIGPFAGHATLVRGTPPVATFQPEPLPLAAIAASLRARFDPRGLFNPGLMA
ncbi:FAD-binding protein [Rhodobacter sp. NSM]|uniref:FAD-binding protein n=1 Tax=Rhodobacter sp. NSM TaxID=3457501 RepID=UPI003FD52F98